MNPYTYAISDLQLNQHSQGEWAWAWLYLSTKGQLWESSTYANPYRQIIADLPTEGYTSERLRQLLNTGLVKYDQFGR